MYLYCCATIIKEEISSFYFHKWRGSHKYSALNLGKVLGRRKKGKTFLSLSELTQPWRTGNQLNENILSAFYRECLMGCKKQTFSPVGGKSTPAPPHCRLPWHVASGPGGTSQDSDSPWRYPPVLAKATQWSVLWTPGAWPRERCRNK